MTAKTASKPRLVSDNKADTKTDDIDLGEMERVVLEAAKQQAPMISRTEALRDELVVKANILVSERAGFVDRLALLTRQYESAKAGLTAQIEDCDAAFALINDGIGDTSPRREG